MIVKIAYFDTVAGVAGDMFVAALLDAGAPWETIASIVDDLSLPEVRLEVREVQTHGVRARTFKVLDARSGMEVEKMESGILRTPGMLLGMIEGSSLGPEVKRHAGSILMSLARAEAHVHSVPVEEVHFHELGAMDTLVDIVAAASAVFALGIECAFCSPVRVGKGTVLTAHGRLPVPAPATARILEGVPCEAGPIAGELTTPTGAAIISHFSSGFGPMPSMIVDSEGFGAGSRDIGAPNVFRVLLGRS